MTDSMRRRHFGRRPFQRRLSGIVKRGPAGAYTTVQVYYTTVFYPVFSLYDFTLNANNDELFSCAPPLAL